MNDIYYLLWNILFKASAAQPFVNILVVKGEQIDGDQEDQGDQGDGHQEDSLLSKWNILWEWLINNLDKLEWLCESIKFH